MYATSAAGANISSDPTGKTYVGIKVDTSETASTTPGDYTWNKYIGDDKFIKFLEHYGCELPLAVVKMRFIGAICSPNMELRPADVINSFWAKGKEPRLQTQKEADLFFKFFMGLWDEMFSFMQINKIRLSEQTLKEKEDVENYCLVRYNEIENGFVEGFWGGKSDLKIPSFIAELMDSLSELADVYAYMPEKAEKAKNFEAIKKALLDTDKMVEKSFAFVIENLVLPKINELRRTVN